MAIDQSEEMMTGIIPVPHDPIWIDGNDDFHTQANNANWPGDGSKSSPYVISGLEISDSNNLIAIFNTDVHFHLSNCLLSDGIQGISLGNVRNGYISNNILFNSIGGQNTNNERGGILVTGSHDNLIHSNTIYKTEWALQLGMAASRNIISSNTIFDSVNGILVYENSYNNKILNNHVYENGLGIGLSNSQQNIISYNVVDSSGWIGIHGQILKDSIFTNNIIRNGESVGIWIGESDNVTISSNYVYRNGADCNINLYFCSNSLISNNTVNEHPNFGILFEATSDCKISSNTVSNNTNYAIYITNWEEPQGTSARNVIQWNNFIGNRAGGGSQARDGGSNNEFSYNYWDDMSGSDVDNDGIIDIAYNIDTSGQDLSPLVSIHQFVTRPIILYPNGGETLNETVVIQWTAAVDSHSHTMVYSLYYSRDSGLTWRIIVSDLTGTSYEWDTSRVGSSYTGLIKVVATCSEGLMSEDISDSIFILELEVSIPTILYPNGGEVVNGLITVRWEIATDSEGHSITYSLLYSSSKGQSWVSLASNLIATSYEWNTSTTQDSSNYLIKVIATCSAGFSAEDVSDSVFTIDNIPPPPNYFLFISFFAMLAVIPELYLGKKFSNFVNRKQIGISGIPEGVDN
jgi:parallel beta-helix repeat protein